MRVAPFSRPDGSAALLFAIATGSNQPVFGGILPAWLTAHRKSAAPVAVKRGHQVYDESLLIICHFRKNRQRQDFPAGCFAFS